MYTQMVEQRGWSLERFVDLTSTNAAKVMGLKPVKVDGLRVTDAESLDVVQMVLVGRVNKRLVSSLSLVGNVAVRRTREGAERRGVLPLLHPQSDGRGEEQEGPP